MHHLHQRFFPALALGLSLSLGASSACAHFFWLSSDGGAAPGKVDVFFSETAAADDPDLLHGVHPEAWAVRRRAESVPLQLKPTAAGLEALLPDDAPAAVILRCTYGVTTRKGETFLLDYGAKTYPTVLPGAWRAIGDDNRLPLEITPRLAGGDVSLTVTWLGKPVAAAALVIDGPAPAGGHEATTDAEGHCQVKLGGPGVYAVRARHIEQTAGQHNGKAYDSKRHYSTLTFTYSPSRLEATANVFPELPRGVTSFGGAVCRDAVYVYGGNYGDAHDFTNEGQSDDLLRLDLAQPKTWERLSSGPKLQGLAMVEHGGKLYRVGGFTARNKAGDEQDLVSQPDFARFDPATGRWEALADLSAGRSSHDAVVLDGTLYVVGGWRLGGRGQEPIWHDTALAADLTEETIAWRPISAPPFKKRALALAAWRGKVYCIGGMREDATPTTAVTIFDPAGGAWSAGPSLLGEGLDGFGVSAMVIGEDLYATTMSGSIQRLTGEGKEWQYMGQLAHPRFFHRLLPVKAEGLLVVGGASMSVGKIREVELLKLKTEPN